jgi:phage baseplate assembly protein gpV
MEAVMRITVKLDGFEGPQSAAYAILWLDKESRRWSREGHQSVEMPDWGALRCGANGTIICCQKDQHTYGVLESLDVDAPGGPCEGVEGRVVWYSDGAGPQAQGRWHVQCIDREQIKAEHSLFAGEPNMWSA